MTPAADQYKDMKNGMIEWNAFDGIQHRTDGVGNTTGNQPIQTGCCQIGCQWFDGKNNGYILSVSDDVLPERAVPDPAHPSPRSLPPTPSLTHR